MKRIVSLVLVLSMVLSMFSFASASSLKDITGTKYEAAVDALMELGVVNGYPDGTYLPNNVVTRAELAKLLVTAYGLEQAAEVAKGATPFSDVGADHWAAGYINVSADYKFVNGYPDGTFGPDKTVTYAEAITMALRVLGYANEIDAKGTWPTNYIAKAQDLKLMRDMEYKSYNDGAQRGNVALLVWNMLRTEMWTVQGESEGDGLQYKPDKKMITVKFSDYKYFDEDDECTLDSITIAKDGKVTAKLSELKGDYELKAGDLVRFVKGMKVAALVNEKEEEILSLVNVDTVIEGRVDEDGEVNDKSYTGITAARKDEYVVFTADGKKAVTVQTLPEANAKELKEKDIKKLVKNDEDAEVLYILDGEWITVNDLKEGDVITEVKNLGNNFVTGTFYAVSRSTVTGSYDGYVVEKDGNETYSYFEVDGEKYDAGEAKVYEYDEKDEEYEEIDDLTKISKKDNKYLDEEIKLVLDYLGNVVAAYFEEINENNVSDVAWYITTGNMWSTAGEDGVKYYYKLTDVNGDEDKYEVDSALFDDTASQSATDLKKMLTRRLEEDDAGDLYVPTDVLLDLVRVAYEDDGVLKLAKDEEFEDGYVFSTYETNAAAEWYAEMFEGDTEIFSKDNDNTIDNRFIVNSNTKVIKIKPVIDDDEVTGLTIDITDGAKELEGVKNAIVVTEVKLNSDNSVKEYAKRASFVFVAEDASSAELNYGLVGDKAIYSKNSKDMIEIDSKVYEVKNVAAAAGEIVKNSYVAYTVDTDNKVSIKLQLRIQDLNDEAFVSEVDGKGEDAIISISGDDVFDIRKTEKAFKAQYGVSSIDDIKFVLINATTEQNSKKEDEVKFEDHEVLEFKDVEFKKYDRIQTGQVNGDTIVLIVRIDNIGKDDTIANGIVLD